ncbi:MAG: hypothetical protein AAB491_00940 [Patescibacteria group bacterium]
MNYEKWWPVVRKAEMAGNALVIHVVFLCPFCDTKSDFETEGHIIDVTIYTLLLEWKFQEIIKPKNCSICGIVSVLPEKEKKDFLKDIKQTITKSWLTQSL